METKNPIVGLTAEDVMRLDRLAIPRRMPMREAAQLLRHVEGATAPVVDEEGKYVGVLTAGDTIRWAEEEGSGAAGCRIPSCPYQAKGLLPGRPEAVSCSLAEGNCVLQVVQPLTGGRVALCRDPHSFSSESQMGGDPEPACVAGRFTTAAHVTAGLRTPLPELARMMIDSRVDRIFILDGRGRPAGVVSALDLLPLVAREGGLAPHRGRHSTPVTEGARARTPRDFNREESAR